MNMFRQTEHIQLNKPSVPLLPGDGDEGWQGNEGVSFGSLTNKGYGIPLTSHQNACCASRAQ